MASKRAARRKVQNNCARKVHYPTRTDASAAAGRLRVRHPGEILDAYPCFCGAGWLVGHRPKRIAQQIRSRRARRSE